MTHGLKIKNISKTWNPDSVNPVVALKNINLDVTSGEFVVLLGPLRMRKELSFIYPGRFRRRN